MRQIFGYSNNGDPGIVRPWQPQRYAPPDRIFVGPVTAGHALVDDCHDRSVTGHVLQSEIATTDQGNAERAKIIRARHLPAGDADVARIERPAFNREGIVARKTA